MSNRARGTRDNGVLVCGIGQVLFPCTTRRVDNCEKINKVLTNLFKRAILRMALMKIVAVVMNSGSGNLLELALEKAE